MPPPVVSCFYNNYGVAMNGNKRLTLKYESVKEFRGGNCVGCCCNGCAKDCKCCFECMRSLNADKDAFDRFTNNCSGRV